MYDENFNKLMKFIYKSEGGFNDGKNDYGGKTMYGITQETYNKWNNRHNLQLKDVRYITKKETEDIYYEWYWKEPGCDKIEDLREAYLLFDMTINSGAYEAKRLFKKSNGNIYTFLKNRKNFYEDFISRNPTQEDKRQGFMNRIKELEENINEIVNSGLYIPSYQNEVTIFDKEYEYSDVVDPYKINKGNNKEITEDDINAQKQKVQNARNRYLYEKHKKEQVSNESMNTATNSELVALKPEPSEAEKKFRSLHPMFEKTNILKNGKPLTSEEWEGFTEGFLSNKIGNPEKRIYENKKTTSNGDDLERGPNGELGHWYTNKGGGHYFVPVA